VGHIHQLESLSYFVEDSAREPSEESVPGPADNEAIVFEEFFTTGLLMPPHPAFTEILLRYQV
jgi:hypothetical protein